MAIRSAVWLMSTLSIVCAFIVPGAYSYFKPNFFSNSVQRQDMQEFCPKVKSRHVLIKVELLFVLFLFCFCFLFCWRTMNNNKWNYSRKVNAKINLCASQVKAIRNFEISGMMGFWYIVQYYASSEEAAEYACMKCNFSMNPENVQVPFRLNRVRTHNST